MPDVLVPLLSTEWPYPLERGTSLSGPGLDSPDQGSKGTVKLRSWHEKAYPHEYTFF